MCRGLALGFRYKADGMPEIMFKGIDSHTDTLYDVEDSYLKFEIIVDDSKEDNYTIELDESYYYDGKLDVGVYRIFKNCFTIRKTVKPKVMQDVRQWVKYHEVDVLRALLVNMHYARFSNDQDMNYCKAGKDQYMNYCEAGKSQYMRSCKAGENQYMSSCKAGEDQYMGYCEAGKDQDMSSCKAGKDQDMSSCKAGRNQYFFDCKAGGEQYIAFMHGGSKENNAFMDELSTKNPQLTLNMLLEIAKFAPGEEINRILNR